MVVGTLTLPVIIMAIITAIFLVFIKLYVHSEQFEGLKTMLTILVSVSATTSTHRFFHFWTSERAILNRMSDKMCHSLWLYLLFLDLAIHTLCLPR